MWRTRTALVAVCLIITTAAAAITVANTADQPAPVAQSPDAQPQSPTIRIATWNIEHMNMLFDQTRLPYRSRELHEVYDDEEDLLEIAMTIKLQHFDPDILLIQEAADQPAMEEFNNRWLGGRYASVHVFASNSAGQWTAVMIKPGYQVLEYRELGDIKDPVDDPELGDAKRYYGRDVLFPRGPGFVKLRTPAGQLMWIGTTHIKSKGGDSPAVARWRVRMIERLRREMGLMRAETDFVMIAGDFNDSFGMDRNEKTIDRDAVHAMLEGKGVEQLQSPTFALATQNPKAATYHSLLRPRDPSFIDHAFLSPALQAALTDTRIITDPIAHVASDHLPVLLTFRFDAADAPSAK